MFAVSICTMPGFSMLNRAENRGDIIAKFKTRAEAEAFALDKAEFGAPFSQQFATLVSRKTPHFGWLVISQHSCDVWEED